MRTFIDAYTCSKVAYTHTHVPAHAPHASTEEGQKKKKRKAEPSFQSWGRGLRWPVRAGSMRCGTTTTKVQGSAELWRWCVCVCVCVFCLFVYAHSERGGRFTLFLMFRARLAYLRVLSVSSRLYWAGLAVAMKSVFELPVTYTQRVFR